MKKEREREVDQQMTYPVSRDSFEALLDISWEFVESRRSWQFVKDFVGQRNHNVVDLLMLCLKKIDLSFLKVLPVNGANKETKPSIFRTIKVN